MAYILKFVRELTALFAALGYAVDQVRELRQRGPRVQVGDEAGERPEPPDDVAFGDDFLYDAVARINEAVVANIDTVDLSLLAVIGGTLAVLVFGIDKIRELAPPWAIAAYWLLGGSVTVCAFGYLIGFGSPRESTDPESFTVAFAEYPGETISVAIKDTARAYRDNARIRLLKRVGVVTALALLIAGTVVIALARSIGAVV
ncbi:MAG: hypothetical protein JO036_21975 [Candidatus Eremiobacteraeota bacterium]|nr:hypothetical protein [Candidatus Eremiobacteraeota bacterium]